VLPRESMPTWEKELEDFEKGKSAYRTSESLNNEAMFYFVLVAPASTAAPLCPRAVRRDSIACVNLG
jgi:hypothetical protein